MTNRKYMEFLKRDKTLPGDNERKALFTILSGNSYLCERVEHFYDFEERAIRPECFEKTDLSGGLGQLVKLAFNLYSSDNEVNITEALSSLDNLNFDLAILAIQIRFGKDQQSNY